MTDGGNLKFQVLDWGNYHEDHGGDLEEFTIRMYGRTAEGKTVYARVDNFTPFFYVEVPAHWKRQQMEILIREVKTKVGKKFAEGLIRYSLVDKYSFSKFNGEKKLRFVHLVFNNFYAFRAFEKIFRRKIFHKYLAKKAKRYRLYESNIEPTLRCMHLRNIKACGWVSIDEGKYHTFKPTSAPTNSDINVSCSWTVLDPVDDKSILPFVIASYDIECTSEDGGFPQAKRPGDQIIQIGTTFSHYGKADCFFKHIITLGSCDPIEGAVVESYPTEREVLIAWMKLIREQNPDIITGWNIFGFDFNYLYERAKLLKCEKEFSRFSRLNRTAARFIEKDLSSSALGDNKLRYYAPDGRVMVDLMKVVQRDFKLQSYKLDYVASYFIQEEVSRVANMKNNRIRLYTKGVDSVEVGQFVTLNYFDGLSDNQYGEGQKFRIIGKKKGVPLLDAEKNPVIDSEGEPKLGQTLILEGRLEREFLDQVARFKLHWCQAKDDVSPNDIFRFQKMGSKERAIIARYCLQDCALCNRLFDKIQVVTNNVGMANVCNVPLSYLFLRGQGVKIFSLVSKKCRELGYVIPVVRKPFKQDDKFQKEINDNIGRKMYRGGDTDTDSIEDEDEDGYEGATVFNPVVGVHYDPIAVLDYASLYPRSMIHRNISHEMMIPAEDFDRFRDLVNYYFQHVAYRNSDGSETEVYYAQRKDGSPGILPRILQELLDARSATKKEMGAEKDQFRKGILDGLQLAYKITANSLYGQTGSPTSPIFMKNVAASTTATGREMLTYAKRFIERVFSQLTMSVSLKKKKRFTKQMNQLLDLNTVSIESGVPFFDNDETKETVQEIIDHIFAVKKIDPKVFVDKKGRYSNRDEFIAWLYAEMKQLLKGKNSAPRIIYGDTDSVFINFHLTDKESGEPWRGLEARKVAIDLGVLAGVLIHMVLPATQDLEYEKTFDPFCILTKKRYVGNLYEFDPHKFKQKSMGIVLKRRDNAPVVKIVVGGIVQKILNEQSGEKAIEFTRETLKKIFTKQYPLDKFVITKTLRGGYKNRTMMPHAVLADRMFDRDPGNSPQSSDRVPYAYIESSHLKCSLCDKPAELSRCKCRECMGMFCIFHLYNHRTKCRKICRLTRVTDADKLEQCPTCYGWYSRVKNNEGESPFDLHKKRENEETGEVFYDKCKKRLSESILQGDIVEHPSYIKEKKLHIDYLFYITNQIMKPAMQFLDLVAYDPEKIFDHYIMRERNRRKGLKPIASYFKSDYEDDEDDDETNDSPKKGEFSVGGNKALREVAPKEMPTRRIIRRKKTLTRPETEFKGGGLFEVDFTSPKPDAKKKPAKKKKPGLSRPVSGFSGTIEDEF